MKNVSLVKSFLSECRAFALGRLWGHALSSALFLVVAVSCSSDGGEGKGDGGPDSGSSDLDGLDTATEHDSHSGSEGDSDSTADTGGTDGDSGADSDLPSTDSETNVGSDGDTETDTETESDTLFVDNDSDDWFASFDCDDENANVNPDMDEIYDPPNGVDDDCDGDTDELPDEPVRPGSYIWIANTGEGTVSKIDTVLEVEVARYITSPLGAVAQGDPSRTTVNRHGDAVVLNRRHPVTYDKSTAASVTKFAAALDDCIDGNGNGVVTSTGGHDLKPWGEDECMLWHTSLGDGIRAARAAAWDGKEDPSTGKGGHVWIGTCEKLENNGATDYVFKLNGDNGEIMETVEFAGCAYGAAMDGDGNLWIVDRDARHAIHRLNTKTLDVDTYPTDAGYGIAIDNSGGIWATGNASWNRVSRYDTGTNSVDTLILDAEYNFPRGAGTGLGVSAGYVWVADNNGYLLKFDENSFTLTKAYPVGATENPSTIGIGIDEQGYVWVVSMGEDAAFKFDPVSETYVTVPVGTKPYTYSDMTGTQLLNQIPVT